MMMPGFDLYYLFRDVMQQGSFARVAAMTEKTPEAIAESIALLETEIGTRLFAPESGGTIPTAGGIYLYDRLDNLLWDMEAVIQQTRAIPPENSMKLVLGISDMIAGSNYKELVRTFSEKHPNIELVLRSLAWTDVRRALIEGQVDAVISYSVLYQWDPVFRRMELTRTKPCIYYSEQILPQGPENATLDSFRDLPFVCLKTDVAVESMLKDLPFKPDRVIFVENLMTLQLYVVTGLACALQGPSLQIAEHSGICSFPCSHVDYTVGADIVWDRSNRNPAVSLLTDCAEKVFFPHP